MEIYKYQPISEYFWKNLINDELWFNNPRNFNDWYDSNLPLNFDYTRTEIEEFIKHSYYNNFGNLERFEEMFSKDIDHLSSNKLEREKYFRDITDHYINNYIGITCFSKEGINTGLWGNYTDNKGVCLVFDSEKDKEYFKNLYNVTYVEKLPSIKLRLEFLPDDLRDYLTIKTTNWKYEDEIRLFRHKSGNDKYDINSLIKVIFGMKTNPKDINKIRSICLLKNKDIKFYRTENGGSNFVLREF